MAEEFPLEEFKTYDATNPGRVIDSADPESSRKWVRKAAFMQLG